MSTQTNTRGLELTAAELKFVEAMDKYLAARGKKFSTVEDMLAVLESLGYG